MDVSIDKAVRALMLKTETWLIDFAASIPNLMVAVLIITVFWFASKGARRLSTRIFRGMHKAGPVAGLVSSSAQVFVMVTGVFIALGILNLDKTVSSLLAGAGVIGLAIGFAFQEIASNFIAGILIAIRKPYEIGDILEIKGNTGRVADINLRTTRLNTFDGLEIIIPNKDMFTSVITNYTATEERRVSLEVGISYSENLRDVQKLVMETMEPVILRVKDRPIEVFFTEFGDSSITFIVRLWIQHSDPKSSLTAISDMVILIKEAFDKNNILIPFPIRTLEFATKAPEESKS